MLFYEVRRLGRWWPRTASQAPRTKTINGVLYEIGMTGDTRYPIRSISEIADEHAGLSLIELQGIYGAAAGLRRVK